MVSQLLIFFIFTFVSTWICANFLRDSGLGDESWIVVDEFAAMLFILAFIAQRCLPRLICSFDVSAFRYLETMVGWVGR